MSEIIIASKGPDIVISRPASYIVFGSGGLQGPPGAVGPRGEGIQFISSLPSTDDLPSTSTLGDTYIISGELWIYGSSGWEDAGPLQGPQGETGETGATGEQGPAGASVELRITETHVQWKLTGGEWDDLVALEDLKGDPGENGAEGPQGDPGENIELQLTETHIQWRAGEAGTWQNLVALADIEGPQGPQGEQGEPGQGLTILGTLDSSGDLPVSGSLGDGYIISGELWVWTGTEWEDVGVIQGPAGTDGRTILSGSVDPTTEGEGEDGDFYINTTSWQIFGPKDTTWPAGVDLIGADGVDGTDGADGRTILSGAVDPTTEGEDGDFYLNTATSTLFGPKDTTWPAGVSLVGPAGVGVPAGGTTGQVLAKSSATDYATEWVDAPSGSGGVSLGMVIALGGD